MSDLIEYLDEAYLIEYKNVLQTYDHLTDEDFFELIEGLDKPKKNTDIETLIQTENALTDFYRLIIGLVSKEDNKNELPDLIPTTPFNSADEWVEHFNKTISVVMVGGKTVILRHVKNISTGRIEVEFGRTNDYKSLLSNKFILDGKNFVNPFMYWLENPARITYTQIDFAPNKTLPPSTYNFWQGFNYNPSTLGSWYLLKHHIKQHICGNNSSLYEYLLDWMAEGVQLPDGKIGVSVVLCGKKGSGKSIFATAYGQLFGRHFLHLTSSRQLTGQFNSHLQDSVIVFADEAFWGGDKQAESNLKGLITEKFIVIEPKFVNSFTMRSYHRLIIASNNDWVIPASEDERRYFVLNVSDTMIGNAKYFEAMMNQLNAGGYNAMLYELQNRNISGKSLRKPPRTEAHSNQVYNSDVVLQYLVHCINERSLFSLNGVPKEWGDGLVLKTRFMSEFDLFCKRLGQTHGINENNLSKKLRNWLCDGGSECFRPTKTRKNIENATSKPDQQYCYQFKSIDECKAMIEKKLGVAWQWHEEIEIDDDIDDHDQDFINPSLL